MPSRKNAQTCIHVTCPMYHYMAALLCRVRIASHDDFSTFLHVLMDHGVEEEGTKVQERHTRTDTALLRWRSCRAPSVERHLTTPLHALLLYCSFALSAFVLLLRDWPPSRSAPPSTTRCCSEPTIPVSLKRNYAEIRHGTRMASKSHQSGGFLLLINWLY
jgi:hypothetical protein